MKTIGIVMTLLLVSSMFAGVAMAMQWNNIQIFSAASDNEAEGDISVSTDITDVDVADANKELEIEVEAEYDGNARDVGFPILWKGQGWVVANDKRSAFVDAVVVGKKVAAENGGVFSTEFGRLKIGEIKLKMTLTESTDSRKIFLLSGANNVKGTLAMTKFEDYEGIDIWKFDISISEAGDSDDSLNGKGYLAVEEKRVKPQIIEEVQEQIEVSYQSHFKLGPYEFKAIARGKPEKETINFYVYGSNNVEGKMRLNLLEQDKDYRFYTGELRVEEIGDSDDILEGKIKVSLKERDGNALVGTITLETKDGETLNGEFQLYEERVVKRTQSSSANSEFEEYKRENKKSRTVSVDGDVESSSSGSVSITSTDTNGFWDRIMKFFSESKK